jgi:hypothetical protein
MSEPTASNESMGFDRTFDNLTGYLYVLLTSHENQDITRRRRKMYLERLFHGTVDIVFARSFAKQNVYRECTTRDSKVRRIIEET